MYAFFGIRSLVAHPYVKRLEPLSFAVGEYYHVNWRMESIMETPGPHWDFCWEFRGRFVGEFAGVLAGVSWSFVRISRWEFGFQGGSFGSFVVSTLFFGFRILLDTPLLKRLEPLSFAVGE